jgi:hypothetical protein
MSFKPPRAPRLAAATPLRRKWAPAGDEVAKLPRALKRRGIIIRPQVDIRVGGVAYAQRRKRRVGASAVPRPLFMTTPSTPKQGDKRLIEWNQWSRLIPRLIPTYLQVLQQSDNLRSLCRDNPWSCGCVNGRSLRVTVYGFDGMYHFFHHVIGGTK